MDVTKSNFDAVQKRIETLLKSCLFVSIDLEFTGLKAAAKENASALNRFDLPSQYYMKFREMIDNFLMIQVGICLWNKSDESRWNKSDESPSKLTAHPFNFWTFPKHNNKSTFLCQTSSLLFLRQHGFDFNKLLDEGINFLSIDEEKKERAQHQLNQSKKRMRVHERKENKVIVEPRTEKDIEFMKEVEIKIQQFIDTTGDKNDAVLELGTTNRFRRLLIYQLIEQKYSHCLIAFKAKNTEENVKLNSFLKRIVIKKVTTDSKEHAQNEHKKQTEQHWNDTVTKCVGVRRIFDMISAHQIPIVVHNGFLDIMHLYRSFIGSLPLDPCEFTRRLHYHLPFIFDTRYTMAYLFPKNGNIPNYSLSQCFQYLSSTPADDSDSKTDNALLAQKVPLNVEVCIEMNEKRNTEKEEMFLLSNKGSFHEAGYDAFCTGYIFAKVGAYLDSLLSDKHNDIAEFYLMKEEQHSNNNEEMVTLSHYVNRLNLSHNICKHFYVGSKYHNDEQFTMNEVMRKRTQRNVDTDDNKNEMNYDGSFCGVDYKSIHESWYKMFHCTCSNRKSMDNIEKLCLQFLGRYISDECRINVYKRGYPETEFAIIRIADITQSEYENILRAFDDTQFDLQFVKYIHYKSNELRRCYQEIYDNLDNNTQINGSKKRTFEAMEHDQSSKTVHCDSLSEPPTKRHRYCAQLT